MQIYAGIFCAPCWGTKYSSKNGPAVKRQLLSEVLSAVPNVGQSLAATLVTAEMLQPPYSFVLHLFLQLAQSSCAYSRFDKKKYIMN